MEDGGANMAICGGRTGAISRRVHRKSPASGLALVGSPRRGWVPTQRSVLVRKRLLIGFGRDTKPPAGAIATAVPRALRASTAGEPAGLRGVDFREGAGGVCARRFGPVAANPSGAPDPVDQVEIAVE